MQGIFRKRICREPILAVDLFTPGGELREQILIALVVYLWNGLAVGFYDLEVVIIDPYAALKVPLFFFNLLGGDIEHVTVKFILLLLAYIKDVVLINFVRSKNKWQPVFDIVEISRSHADS